MSISGDERAAIEAFIKERGVTQCPAYLHTPPEEVRYKDGRRRSPFDEAALKLREKIADMARAGATNKEICEALSVSPYMAQRHSSYIRFKMSQESR